MISLHLKIFIPFTFLVFVDLGFRNSLDLCVVLSQIILNLKSFENSWTKVKLSFDAFKPQRISNLREVAVSSIALNYKIIVFVFEKY